MSEKVFHNHTFQHSRKKNMSQKINKQKRNLHKNAAKTGSGARISVLFFKKKPENCIYANVYLLIDTVASFSVNQRKINFPAPESVFKAVLRHFYF